MLAYPIHKSHPFAVKDDYGGVCHGLVLTDELDRLCQPTGQERHLDEALWLSDKYSETELSADDVRLARLTDGRVRFCEHGVHTYEHLRCLLTAVYASNNPIPVHALKAYLAKLEICLTPRGAPGGDEMSCGRFAGAFETG